MPISGRQTRAIDARCAGNPRFRRNIAAIGDSRVSLEPHLSRIARRGKEARACGERIGWWDPPGCDDVDGSFSIAAGITLPNLPLDAPSHCIFHVVDLPTRVP